MLRHRKTSSTLWFIGLTLCLLAPSVGSAQEFDSSSFRVMGARSTGGMLVPSASLLDDQWEASVTFVHDQLPVRAELPTGTVRGGARTEPVDYIRARNILSLRGVVGIGNRAEVFASLPVLLHQATRDGTQLDGPLSGSSVLGDVSLGARFALLDPEETSLRWTLGAALRAPTGRSGHAFSEERVHASIFTELGFVLSHVFDFQVLGGFDQATTVLVGDQFFGDELNLGALARVRVGPVSFVADAIARVVVADRPAGSDPERTSVEGAAGVRYTSGNLFVDGGASYGFVDNGSTPRWRTLVSIGATGTLRANADDADGDFDGIPDSIDGCPTRAEDFDLFEDDDGCPDDDNDEDGIADTRDACPDSPEDFDGIADDDGCPDVDVDRDGVDDENDGCPEAPEDFDGFEDDDGCPEAGAPEPLIQRVEATASSDSVDGRSVHFATGSSALTPIAEERLREIASSLQDSTRTVVVVGHADERGTEDLNAQLSEDRAQSVQSALVDAGINPERVIVRGAGEYEPVGPPTSFGMSMNRRATFHWHD